MALANVTRTSGWSNPGEEEPDALSQSFNVVAGKRYAFNGYYSVLDLALSSCHIKTSIGGTMLSEVQIYSSFSGSPIWYKLEGIYTAPSTGQTDLLLQLWCDYRSIGGIFGLDDISVVQLY